MSDLPCEVERARAICRGCSVRTECLAEAIRLPWAIGVWGGLTAEERRALRGPQRKYAGVYANREYRASAAD
jgi:hypothetical protein